MAPKPTKASPRKATSFLVAALASVCTVLLVSTWLFFSGAWRSVDGLAIEVALIVMLGAVGVRVVGWLVRKFWITDPSSESDSRKLCGAAFVGGLMLAWFGVSAFTLWRSEPLLVDPVRFKGVTAEASIVPEEAQAWRNKRIGIALSGGGYRAALFHAGTLHALEKLGVRVQAVSAVSGGAIIGAYYATGGDPALFKQAMLNHSFNLSRELILAHHALRLPLPMRIPGTDVRLLPWWNHDRVNVQASMLRRLLGFVGDWRTPSHDAQPELLIAATDLTYGMLVGFIHDGILIHFPEGRKYVYRNDAIDLDRNLDMADLVATSGAFPIAFPPVSLGVRAIASKDWDGEGNRPLILVDGGVGDNSGLRLLLAAREKACCLKECALDACDARSHMDQKWALDAVVSSNAGAIFEVEQGISGLGVLQRAFDVAATSEPLAGDLKPVEISPSRYYPSRDIWFQGYDEEDRVSNKEDRPEKWFLSLEILDFPLPILAVLVDLLPTNEQAKGRRVLAEHVEFIKTQLVDRGDDLQAHGCSLDEIQGICAQAVLHDLIVNDIYLLLEEFSRTSTLADTMSAKRVNNLFRLGQYLTYVSWPRLFQELSR